MKFIIPILLAMTLPGCGTFITFYGGGDGLTVTTTQADGTEHTVNWPAAPAA